MSKYAFLIIFLLLVVGSYFAIQSLKESYPSYSKRDSDQTKHEQWHPFTSPERHFHVKFPVLPQHSKEGVRDPATNVLKNYNMYLSEKNDGTEFLITTISFPKKDILSDPEMQLTKIMNEMLASNSLNQLKNKKIGTFHGLKDLEFTIQNDQVVIHTKTFMKDDTLYVISVLGPIATYQQDEFDYFVNSFFFMDEDLDEEDLPKLEDATSVPRGNYP